MIFAVVIGIVIFVMAIWLYAYLARVEYIRKLQEISKERIKQLKFENKCDLLEIKSNKHLIKTMKRIQG